MASPEAPPPPPPERAPVCPICGKPRRAEFKPFCSARCADRDLHRWFSGAYAIAAAPVEEDDEDRAQDESR